MNNRLIKVPKAHFPIYEQAKRKKRRLKEEGFDKPLFDIMTEILNNKETKPPRWSI